MITYKFFSMSMREDVTSTHCIMTRSSTPVSFYFASIKTKAVSIIRLVFVFLFPTQL